MIVFPSFRQKITFPDNWYLVDLCDKVSKLKRLKFQAKCCSPDEEGEMHKTVFDLSFYGCWKSNIFFCNFLLNNARLIKGSLNLSFHRYYRCILSVSNSVTTVINSLDSPVGNKPSTLSQHNIGKSIIR